MGEIHTIHVLFFSKSNSENNIKIC